jgi:hypothetical protein
VQAEVETLPPRRRERPAGAQPALGPVALHNVSPFDQAGGDAPAVLAAVPEIRKDDGSSGY